MTTRWLAPGRVNLMGEHLDYNGGPVLPIAVDRQAVVTATLRDDGSVRATSTLAKEPAEFPLTTRPGQVMGWGAYVAGVVWALTDAGHQVPGLDIALDSDVPYGAGLSSSAAIECAVAGAIRDLAGLDIDDVPLALLCQRAENVYVRVPCGAMDQIASMCGKKDHALLIDTQIPAVQPIPARWTADGLVLLVVDTRVTHSLADGAYARRRRECDAAAKALGIDHLAEADPDTLLRLDEPALRSRVRHVVTETARVSAAVRALVSRRWSDFGELMVASHASLRDDFAVSCPELDTAVDAAVRTGALGARMTGGGFGGSAIALVPENQVDAVEEAVTDAFRARRFAAPPRMFAVAPSGGAQADNDLSPDTGTGEDRT